MASTRRRYPTKPEPEVSEEVSNLFVEVEAPPQEEVVELPIDETPTPVFVEESITPMPDPGPRFLEKEIPTPHPQAVTPPVTPQIQPPSKRHPRNTPKFSRYK